MGLWVEYKYKLDLLRLHDIDSTRGTETKEQTVQLSRTTKLEQDNQITSFAATVPPDTQTDAVVMEGKIV